MKASRLLLLVFLLIPNLSLPIYFLDFNKKANPPIKKLFSASGALLNGRNGTIGSCVLVSPSQVLTAARNVYRKDKQVFRVGIAGKVYQVIKREIHPGFSNHAGFSIEFDIALLELNKDVPSEDALPLLLNSKQGMETSLLEDQRLAWFAGNGLSNNNTRQLQVGTNILEIKPGSINLATSGHTTQITVRRKWKEHPKTYPMLFVDYNSQQQGTKFHCTFDKFDAGAPVLINSAVDDIKSTDLPEDKYSFHRDMRIAGIAYYDNETSKKEHEAAVTRISDPEILDWLEPKIKPYTVEMPEESPYEKLTSSKPLKMDYTLSSGYILIHPRALLGAASLPQLDTYKIGNEQYKPTKVYEEFDLRLILLDGYNLDQKYALRARLGEGSATKRLDDQKLLIFNDAGYSFSKINGNNLLFSVPVNYKKEARKIESIILDADSNTWIDSKLIELIQLPTSEVIQPKPKPKPVVKPHKVDEEQELKLSDPSVNYKLIHGMALIHPYWGLTSESTTVPKKFEHKNFWYKVAEEHVKFGLKMVKFDRPLFDKNIHRVRLGNDPLLSIAQKGNYLLGEANFSFIEHKGQNKLIGVPVKSGDNSVLSSMLSVKKNSWIDWLIAGQLRQFSNKPIPKPEPVHVKWNLMFYFKDYASRETDQERMSNYWVLDSFNSLAKKLKNPHIRILIHLERSSKDTQEQDGDKLKNFKGTRRWAISYNDSNKQVEVKTVLSSDEIQEDQQKTLTNYLSWVNKEYQCNKNFLMIGDWDSPEAHSGFGGWKKFNTYLSVSDVKDALNKSGMKHVDILYSNARLGQTIEKAFEMKDMTDFLVMSQHVPHIGTPHNKFIRALYEEIAKNTGAEVETIVKNVFDNTQKQAIGKDKDAVFTLVKTRGLEGIATKLNLLTNALGKMKNSNGNWVELPWIVDEAQIDNISLKDNQKLVFYAKISEQGYAYDLFVLLNQLHDFLQDDAVGLLKGTNDKAAKEIEKLKEQYKQLFAGLKDDLERAVIARSSKIDLDTKKPINGLSIFIPISAQNQEYGKLEFSQEFGPWLELVKGIQKNILDN